MSGLAQGKVYTMSVTGSDMLVLLAYADHADDYGKKIYPSIDTIAWKVGLSRRQIQRITKKYVDLGWLRAIGKTKQGVTWLEFDYDSCQYKPDLDAPKSPEIAAEGVTSGCHGGGDIAMSRGGDIAMSPNPSLTVIKPICANAQNVSVADSSKPKPNDPLSRTDTMTTNYGKSHDAFFISSRPTNELKVRGWKLPLPLEDLSIEFVRLTGIDPRGGEKRSDKGLYAADAKDWLDAKFTVDDMREAYQRCNGKFPITHLGALYRDVQERKRNAPVAVETDMIYTPSGKMVLRHD